MIQSIGIKNWRSIGENGLSIQLGRITVLVGANDTGKSSFLFAGHSIVNFLSQKKDEFFDTTINTEGSIHENEHGEVSGDIEISLVSRIVGDLERAFNSIYTLDSLASRITTQIINSLYLQSDLKQRNDEWAKKFDEVMFFLTSHIRDIEVKYVLKPLSQDNNALGKIDCTNFMGRVSEFLKENKSYDEAFFAEISEFAFGGFSKHCLASTTAITSLFISTNREYNINNSMKYIESKNTDLNLEHDPSELIRFIQLITSEKLRRLGKYKKLIEYTQIMFPEITEIETGIIEGSNNSLDVFLKWNKNGITKRQPLSRSGSGVVNSIYLVAKLLLAQKNSTVVFIDEPETGMHPRLQVRLIKLLRALHDEFLIQWVIATHSPFIMKNLKNNDLLYLTEHNGIQSKIRLVNPNNKEIVFNAIGSYLPDTLISKGIIFVEGATEAAILPVFLSKVGIDLDREQIVILPLGGENLFGIEPEDFIKIHEKIMIVIDSDLTKSEKNGGKLTKKKTDFEKECSSKGIRVFLSREYRCIENIYPKEVLAEVLDEDVSQLTHGPYDKIPQISDGKKVIIGTEVAKTMKIEQVRDLALTKSILEWLD